MKRQLALFLLIILAGCAGRQVFTNRVRNYKLVLKKDSVYFLKRPAFFGKYREHGTYKIEKNTILLKRITGAPSESVKDFGFGFSIDDPDTVAFSFRNINDSDICVDFTINNNPTTFKTDNSGHLKLLYRDLISNKVISNDSAFHSITIFYNNKTYFLKELISGSLIKPSSIRIQLNQFIGEKSATWYRKYSYSNDSIIVNDGDWNGELIDIKLTRK
jgi:hypothetical protein